MKILPLAKKPPRVYDKKSINTIADMTYEKGQESDYKKISTREFVNVSWWMLKFVFSLDPKHTILYSFFTILNGLYGIVNSYVFAKILDSVLALQAGKVGLFGNIYHILAIIAALFIVSRLIGNLDSYFKNVLRNITRPKLTQALYTKLNELGVQSLEQPEINNKITRANMHLQEIYPFVDGLIQEISNITNLIGSAATLILVSPLLLVFMVIFYIPYVLYDRKYRGLMYKHSYDNTESARKAGWSSQFLNSSQPLQEVSVTSSFGYLDEKYMTFQRWYLDKWTKISRSWRIGNGALSSFTDLALLFGYSKIFRDLISQTITVGTATFQTRMMNMLQSNLSSAFRGLNDLFETALRLKDTYALFQYEPLCQDGKETFPKITKGPSVSTHNVSFKYPGADTYVFKDLSLNIKDGEKIALVGHNGAGKTTLVKLLCRIYRPTSGHITVNDRDLQNLKIADWYKNIGVLFQDFNQYPQLTVKENIYIGNTSEPPDELGIRLAAQNADALEFIEEFPKKFDQILSEKFKGGVRPSTGQWQKIAIARFFYRNAPLVIFDEPTASIDAVSEFNIFNRIYDFFKGKTVIIISHRFSTVRNADRIIVLDHGKIIEEGTHEQLMDNGGYYARAFHLQARGYGNNQTASSFETSARD